MPVPIPDNPLRYVLSRVIEHASSYVVVEHRPLARTDRLVTHDDMVDTPGLRPRAGWTPGHPQAHLRFHDGTHALLLACDRVLPRITPNVSAYDLESALLGDYLDSQDPAAFALPQLPFRQDRLGERNAHPP